MHWIWLSLALVSSSDAARILGFVPIASKSHHLVFRPILEALAEKGHEVVYYTGIPYEDGIVPKGVTQVDLSGCFKKLTDESNKTPANAKDKKLLEGSGQGNVMNLVGQSMLSMMMMLKEIGTSTGSAVLGCPPVQQLIHSDQKFDAVVMSSYAVQEYLSAFIHKFGAVGIEVQPLGDFTWVNELSGISLNEAFQNDFKAELTPNMNFWQRLYNTYVTYVTVAVNYYYMPTCQRLMDQYFNYTGWESRPPIGQLLSNMSLVLINSHPAVGYPTPGAPHWVKVGGICVRPSKPLPQGIQKFMDESKDGVIYFSLGSHLKVSDPANTKIIEAFMKVFQELPQRVLMKWETEYPGELPKNVRVGKWFPQQDILAHKNCVLFITHGGYLSLTEAVHFGVPLVGIPYFGDQPKNLLFVEDAGIGKMLRLSEINYQTVSSAVKEVLSNKSYKENMLKRSRIFRDRRHSPVEEAVYWIEYVIKYPNVLIPKGASLSFVQLHLIDVWLFVLLVLSLLLFVVWKSLTTVVRIVKRKRPQSSEKLKRN